MSSLHVVLDFLRHPGASPVVEQLTSSKQWIDHRQCCLDPCVEPWTGPCGHWTHWIQDVHGMVKGKTHEETRVTKSGSQVVYPAGMTLPHFSPWQVQWQRRELAVRDIQGLPVQISRGCFLRGCFGSRMNTQNIGQRSEGPCPQQLGFHVPWLQ